MAFASLQTWIPLSFKELGYQRLKLQPGSYQVHPRRRLPVGQFRPAEVVKELARPPQDYLLQTPNATPEQELRSCSFKSSGLDQASNP
jgi:hypothetical protein